MEFTEFPQPEPRPQLCYGTLRLGSRYVLSPLAGYTNLPFRRIVRELGGVGLATTDLVNARALLTNSPKTAELVETCAADRPFAVQLFGADPGVMAEAAALMESRGVDSIDINMGCPVQKITKSGAGASMLCRPDETVRLVERVVNAVRVPVTVKVRLGWDETQLTAPYFARAFEEVGIAAITVHGRTRAQGFSGTVNREGIRAVVEAVRRIPVIGNGDVRSIPEAARMLAETGCQGVGIGRGALANPWIFAQLAEWEQTGRYGPSGNFEQRLELFLRQFRYLIEQKGIERGIPFFRKMAHWYLRAMKVPAVLRNQFQIANTLEEVDAAVRMIVERGPTTGDRSAKLPDMHIPVPSGPVERW